MKTRGLGVVILLSMAVGVAVVSTGCNATSVVSDKDHTAPAAVVVVTNVPAPADAAAGGSPTVVAATGAEVAPVQKSVRPAVALPEDVVQVVQLVESGAGDEVVRAYVEASTARYELTLDQIIYLRDIGISDGVIAAVMRRGSDLREKDAEAAVMQTNLVAAVEQIKEGLAAGGYAETNAGAPEPVPGAGAGLEAGAAPPAPGQGQAPVPASAGAVVAVHATQVPVEAPQPVQQFYTSLSPYGTWYQVPTYGWVWQPSVVVVDRTWMPYRHGGRWLWTDQGWYWNSEYSWGWAPFHYGRWAMHPGLGWCWAPDSVWGPSWVTWRHSGGYVGWAPLPFHSGWSHGVGLTWYGSGISVGFSFGLTPSCYTFVPGRRFGHRNISHHAVRGSEHDGAFRQSTVVNNVINGDNNVIVNNGIGYNQVASMSRDEIPKARVQPLPGEASSALRADRMERGKDGFVVYRPTEVATVGGRPTLRSEVRPVSAPSGSTSRALGAVPSRSSGTGSPRFTGTTGSAVRPAKSAETRGGSALSTPASNGARPVPNVRSSGVSGTPGVARPYSGTPSVRGTEGRPANGVGRAAPVGNTPAAVGVPRRETAPVPLGNPNRFLPRGSGTDAAAGRPVTSAQPTRSGNEARGNGVAPTVAPAAAPVPTARPFSNARPGFQSSSAPQPRATVATPLSTRAVPASPGRSSFSTPAPAMSIPARPSYSAPAPAMAPARPSYSAPAPAPAMSVPRPSYSAPAPVVSAPRAAPAAPAAPVATPSGRGGGTTRNAPRTQQN